MKGLYVNIPYATSLVAAFDKLLGVRSCTGTFCHPSIGTIVLSFRPSDWPDGPAFESPDRQLLAIASGWLSYRGRLGALRDLVLALANTDSSEDVITVLRGIDGGAFLLLIADRRGTTLITDPFGLHPHYIRRDSPLLQLAPAPSFLRTEETLPDSPMSILINRLNHPVGDRTAFADIVRLRPGRIHRGNRSDAYFPYEPLPFHVDAIWEEFRRLRACFARRPTLLPISGGLDSRLLLASGPFDYGFTFGPEHTGDRPIAKAFRRHFTRGYDSFSLTDLQYPKRLAEAARLMFDGVCPMPFAEILAVFSRVALNWGSDCVLFDGYLGDVLTRGSWFNLPSWCDRVMRIFPRLRVSRLRADTTLRRRYAAVDDETYHEVARAFEDMTEGASCPPLTRLLLFEILYGRGARYIINGNGIMAGQFFTSVQAFFWPGIFRRLLSLSPYDLVSFRALRALWASAPPDLRSAVSLDGYAPIWPPSLSRLGWLVVALSRSVTVRRTYSDELPLITWYDE